MTEYTREQQVQALLKVQAIFDQARLDAGLSYTPTISLDLAKPGDPRIVVEGMLFIEAGEVVFPAKNYPAYLGSGYLIYTETVNSPATRGGEVLDDGSIDASELAVCATTLETVAAVLAEVVRFRVIQAAENRYYDEQIKQTAGDLDAG